MGLHKDVREADEIHRREECLPLGGISALLINAANCIIRNVKHIANVNLQLLWASRYYAVTTLRIEGAKSKSQICLNLVNIFPD